MSANMFISPKSDWTYKAQVPCHHFSEWFWTASTHTPAVRICLPAFGIRTLRLPTWRIWSVWDSLPNPCSLAVTFSVGMWSPLLMLKLLVNLPILHLIWFNWVLGLPTDLYFKPASVDFNNNRLLRPIIISFLGGIGYGDVISTAQSAFKRQYAAVTSALVVEATVEHAKLISPFQISFDNRKILVASIWFTTTSLTMLIHKAFRILGKWKEVHS